MGTRADFYVGRDPKSMEWLGSIAFDGYPGGLEEALLSASTEERFRSAVGQRLDSDDGTRPDQGWPWPWEDSRTSDYAYAFDGCEVWLTLGSPAVWATTAEDRRHRAQGGEHYEQWLEEIERERDPAHFPNMSDRQSVVIGGSRSGMLVIESGPDGFRVR